MVGGLVLFPQTLVGMAQPLLQYPSSPQLRQILELGSSDAAVSGWHDSATTNNRCRLVLTTTRPGRGEVLRNYREIEVWILPSHRLDVPVLLCQTMEDYVSEILSVIGSSISVSRGHNRVSTLR